jgi:hypothetical protein
VFRVPVLLARLLHFPELLAAQRSDDVDVHGLLVHKSASGNFNVQRSSEDQSGKTTDSVGCTQTQLDKQVEHAVDREEYLRRDREIQRALERMATKDELREVNDTLRSIQESIAPRHR